MLTYDALIEQGKARGMPATKMRGILREYLQVLLLKEICRTESAGKLHFTGGTYLRLVHFLKRFSEDLDFNASGMAKGEFESVVRGAGRELQRIGFDSKIEWIHWGNLYAAKLVFPDAEKAYGIVSKHSKKEGMTVKVETNRPAWKIKNEVCVVTGFGEFYPVGCTDKGALFADKIDALVKKKRARHLYDILFMLSNRYPIDRRVLRTLGITRDPLDVIRERVLSFSKGDLKRQADNLRPFLFEEHEADLLARAHVILPRFLENYRQRGPDK